jgi:DNA recombination protein RmuC
MFWPRRAYQSGRIRQGTKQMTIFSASGFDLVHMILIAIIIGLGFVMMRGRSAGALESQRLTLEAAQLRGDLAETEGRAAFTEQRLTTQEAVARQAELALADLRARSEGDEHRFADLAQGVLAKANQQFLQLANETFEKHREGAKGQLSELIQPIRQNMEAFSQKVEAIEKVRTEDKSLLQEQVKAIGENLRHNTAETGKLVSVLTAPKGGGRWGEMTLRNVLEQAGLSAHCDFSEQVTDSTEEGRQRPDAIIHLPGGRQIVVDSKVSLDAYMSASKADDPAQKISFLKAHAASVQRHVSQLAAKDYQANLDSRFDYIAMFIPGENFFAAALDHAPELIEKAMSRKVIVTTPTTLIALARTVAHLWRQHEMNEHAMEAASLAADLYNRIGVMLNHTERLGKSLNGSVESYNKLVGSLDKRVIPALRRLEDLSIAPPDKPPGAPIRIEGRAQSPEKIRATPLLDYDDDAPVAAE